jgi:HK97 gp10 family phage protein
MQIQFQGLTEMVAKLEKARVDMGGPEMKKALRAGGRVIQKAMEERAPVLDAKTPGSDALEPGALKASIRVSVVEDDGETAAIIGPNGKTAHVARFVEYGHRQVTGGQSKLLGNGTVRGAGKNTGKDVPPHPFLRPSFEESVGEAGEAIAASLSESFQEVLGGK